MLGAVERSLRVLEDEDTPRHIIANRAFNACKIVQEKAKALGIKAQDPVPG